LLILPFKFSSHSFSPSAWSIDVNKYSLRISSFLVVFEDNIVTFGEKFKKQDNFFSMGTSCTDLLALFVPDVYPSALAAGKRIAGNAYDLSYSLL